MKPFAHPFNTLTALAALTTLCFSSAPSAQAQSLFPYDTAAAPSEQSRYTATSPQYVGVPTADGLVVASQRYASGKSVRAVVTQFRRSGSGFVQGWEAPLPLPRLVGLTSDGAAFYAVSAADESLGKEAAGIQSYRPNVLVMTKLDAAGKVMWQRDLNNAQVLGDVKDGVASAGIYSPLVAGTGAVVHGQGKVVVTLATNTLPDRSIGGVRHQRAQYFVVDENGTGLKAANETSWRHSFDQRLIFDGQDFVYMDVADAGWFMPGAGITLRKIQPTATGANFTGNREGTYIYVRQGDTAGSQNFSFISLGNLQTSNSGYAALFTSEKSNRPGTRDGWKQPVLEPRNLAYVHVKRGFEAVKEGRWGGAEQVGNTVIDGQPKTITVTANVVDSQGVGASFQRADKPEKSATSAGVVWLTNLAQGVSAERPKLVKVGADRFVAVWEEWTYAGTQLSHRGTQAMAINGAGQPVAPATPIAARLNPSGADVPFAWNGSAAWVTGDAATGALMLNTVDPQLRLNQTPLLAGTATAGPPTTTPTTTSTPTTTPTTTPSTSTGATPTTTPTTTTPPPPGPANTADRFPIRAGTNLVPGRQYRSESGQHYLLQQPDGNLVIYDQANRYVWGLQSVAPRFRDIREVSMQPDGNLAAYGANRAYIWSALHKNPDPTAVLNLTPQGVLQMVSGRTGAVLWASDGRLTPETPTGGGGGGTGGGTAGGGQTTVAPPPLTPQSLEIGKQYALRSGQRFMHIKLLGRETRLAYTPCPNHTQGSQTRNLDLPDLMRVADAQAQGLTASNVACDLGQVPLGR